MTHQLHIRISNLQLINHIHIKYSNTSDKLDSDKIKNNNIGSNALNNWKKLEMFKFLSM